MHRFKPGAWNRQTDGRIATLFNAPTLGLDIHVNHHQKYNS